MTGRAAALAVAATLGFGGHAITWILTTRDLPGIESVSGIVAGFVAGAFTLWSKRIGGRGFAEFGWTVATAVVGVAVWFTTLAAVSIAVEALAGRLVAGAGQGFALIGVVLLYALLPCGPFVLTGCYASRRLVWWVRLHHVDG